MIMLMDILIWVVFLLLGWDIHVVRVIRQFLKSIKLTKKNKDGIATIRKKYKHVKIEMAVYLYILIALIYLSQTI